MHQHLILPASAPQGTQPHQCEPTIGKWYCGMTINGYAEDGAPHMGGDLMRYEGDGVWSSDDEQSERDPDPSAYDYLAEQL
ncbi:MAG: hypothetical protein AB7K71_33800 [Polyangiaceae bacterium]